MSEFDDILIIDWSAARNGPTTPRKPPKDRIYMARPGHNPAYFKGRTDAFTEIKHHIETALAANKRLFIGIDVGFGFPKGITEQLTGQKDARAIWALLNEKIIDDPITGRHNAFEVAQELNNSLPGDGPFWGRLGPYPQNLPIKKPIQCAFDTLRATEKAIIPKPKSMLQLAYAGAVGAQSLLAMARLHQLRTQYRKQLAIWPFDNNHKPNITIVELYLSTVPLPSSAPERQRIFADKIKIENGRHLFITDKTKTKDPLQVATFCAVLSELNQLGKLENWLTKPTPNVTWLEEGLIFGVGKEATIADIAKGTLLGTISPQAIRLHA